MSASHDDIRARAEALRRAFDDGFAEAPTPRRRGDESYLAIRVGDRPYALRVRDIAGLYADRAIVPVPSDAPALLGVAAFRGVMAPVFDLRVALAQPAGAAPAWLVLVHTPEPVGLAFDLFEEHFTPEQHALVAPAAPPGSSNGASASRIVRGAGEARPIVDLAGLIAKLAPRSPASALRKAP
ncbi:MAG: chemotaxis protein CheW [Polyangiaceae bacterium]